MSNSAENKIDIYLIRHGATAGNLEKRYIGRTDEPLCEKGIAKVKSQKYPDAKLLFVSPLQRCRQTANLIYPGLNQHVVEGFRETDFGDFEGKNYEELKDDLYYQRWIDSEGTLPFLNGESRAECDERIIRAFEDVLLNIKHSNAKSAALVVHGGTIMSIMSKYDGKNYYDYQIKNGEFLHLCITI